MTTINLKDFYAWYTHDEYIEVSDEVAAELKADKLYEAAHQRRTTRNKAQYSLDCDDAAEKTTYRICCGWLRHHRQLCRLQKCGSAPSCKADFTIFLCQQYGKK